MIEKYSFGMGDRFARQGRAQLQAVIRAKESGIAVAPVWNKSNREHVIVGSEPEEVRQEVLAAVKALNWEGPYHLDADHINLQTVDRFLAPCDFFTLDVADCTGRPAAHEEIERFVQTHAHLAPAITVPGIAAPLEVNACILRQASAKFLLAMQEAGRIFRHIAASKPGCIIEVSVDETDKPQSPAELLLILAMLAAEGVPVQTIAPKFAGRFNKGIDYEGSLAQFEKEFDEDLAILAFAVREFGLPESLKLSVHSGSDKFSLYPIINRLVRKHSAGLHLKTAGTTWLEEVLGLAEAGGEGLAVAREIYAMAYDRFEALVLPYAAVVDIDRARLPRPEVVNAWTSAQYAAALRHDPLRPEYSRDFRQFLHVSFKCAAELGTRYLDSLAANEEIVARNVTGNLLERHLVPIFAGLD